MCSAIRITLPDKMSLARCLLLRRRGSSCLVASPPFNALFGPYSRKIRHKQADVEPPFRCAAAL